MILIAVIVFALFALFGLYLLIRPDNFLFPYIGFGTIRYAKKYIRTNKHRKHVLVMMRVIGALIVAISLNFLIDAILS